MIRALLVVLSLLSFLLAAPRAAHAQRSDMTTEERQEAKRLFDQAHLAYRRGNYEEAIIKWEKSFEISQHPLIFESISHAYERLGKLEEAKDYLTKWREHAHRREHRSLDERIANLEARVLEKKQADRELHAEEDKLRREKEQLEKEAADERERKRREQEGRSTEEILVETVLPWSLVGTGAAAIVVGVVMGAVASSSRPEETEACRDLDGLLLCNEGQRGDIESSNTLSIAGDVLWITGAVMAAAGGTLLIMGELGGDDAGDDARTSPLTVAVAPLVGPTGGGVSVSATF